MYVLVNYPIFKAFTAAGVPAVGYKVYSYEAGTATPVVTYSERTLTTPNANPTVLDSAGEAVIYVGRATKLVLKTDADVEVWTFDYLGEQQATYIVGEPCTGTTNNNYVVDVDPDVASLVNGMMLVMTPDVDNADTLTSQIFTGTGINDGVFTGPYVGTTSGSVFTVEIDGVATPNTFRWKKDGGAWTSGVAITAAAQILQEGVSIDFATTTGHTSGDIWALTVETPARVNLCALGNKLIYKNVGGTLQALDGADMKADIPACLIYSTDQDCFILTNPSDPVLETIIPRRIRKELTGDYNVVLGDEGTELSCTGPLTLTLPDCPDVPNSFFYFHRVSGTITIDAGTYEIFLPNIPTHVHSFEMSAYGFDTIQMVTNGVNWHILTTADCYVRAKTIYTSDDTWTRPSYVKFVWALVLGAGGGGGGATGASPATGGGGGGGSLVMGCYDVSAASTVAVTVGTGGPGGTGATTGTTGETSSFGSYASAPGGVGGTGGNSSNGTGGTRGQISLYTSQATTIGEDGSNGTDGSTGGGDGGDAACRRGDGGTGRTGTSGNGSDGGNYGSGGGGAYTSGGGSYTGGAGAPGLVVVWY